MKIFESCPFFDKRNGMKYCEDPHCAGDVHFDDFETDFETKNDDQFGITEK